MCYIRAGKRAKFDILGQALTGELVKLAISSFMVAALVLAAPVERAHAQGMSGRRQIDQNAAKAEAKKPKADERAYRDALKTVPNKSYDPWQGAR